MAIEAFLTAPARGALSATAKAIVGKMLQKRESWVENPARVGTDIRTPAHPYKLDEKAVSALVRELLLRVADFDSEVRGLHEGPAVQVVLVKVLTGDVSLESMRESNYDLEVMQQRLETPHRQEIDALSSRAQSLFSEILEECVAQIVDFYSSTPAFASAALFDANGRIARVEREVLEGSSRRNESFLVKYKEYLSSDLDEQQLFGLSLPISKQTYTLSTAYVNLNVSTEDAGETREGSVAGNFLTGKDLEAGIRRRQSAITVSGTGFKSSTNLSDLLNESSRLAIEGEAGCGKTTLMKRIALHLARGDAELPAVLADFVPVYVRVRELVLHNPPSPEELIRIVAKEICDEKPGTWLTEMFRRRRVLLLVDGLDEVANDMRVRTLDWLIRLMRTFSGNRCVVTSRPGALSGSLGTLLLHGFRRSWIEPMSPRQIEEFIQRWHDPAVHPHKSQDELERNEKGLRDALFTRRDLRRLATTPLLCGMLCALSEVTNQELPKGRTELYRAALDMMLGRRDMEQEIRPEEVVLDNTQVQPLLRKIAIWMYENDQRIIAEDTAAVQIEELVPRLRATVKNSEEVTPKRVLDVLIARSGLLQMPEEGWLEFRHPSFQDYLSASELLRKRSFFRIVTGLADTLHQDVFIMAIGQSEADAEVQDELLTNVIALAKSHNRRDLWLLCGAAVADVGLVNKRLLAEIESETRKYSPPGTLRQAAEVAKAGIIALDLLAQASTQRSLTTQEAQATIHSLCLIGSPDGYQILRSIALKHGEDYVVQEELAVGLHRFQDPIEYAREVLADIPLDKIELEFPHNFNLQLIPALTGLRAIDLGDVLVDGQLDLSILESQKNLRELALPYRIDSSSIINSSVLASLTELEMLSGVLGDEQVKYVANLPNLRRIDLGECALFTGAGLTLPPSLTSIDLSGSGVHDLNFLRDCSSLKRLVASGTPLSDIGAIGGLRALQTVDLSSTNVADISALHDLDSLKSADFASTRVRDIQSLAGKPRLEILHLLAAPISDLTPLAGSTSLVVLDLSETPVRDIGPLSSCTRLTRVVLDGSKVRDVTPLLELPILASVGLGGIEHLVKGAAQLQWILMRQTESSP